MVRRIVALLGAFVLALGVGLTAPTTAYAACGEQTKFVQQVYGTNLYFGNRGSEYVYDHLPICSGGATAQSFFVRLSDDYLSWAETGTSQYGGDQAGYAHLWTEWADYPSLAVVKTYDSTFGRTVTGKWLSFKVENGIGTTWNLSWSDSSNPDAASWVLLSTTPSMQGYVGEVESEFSRYGQPGNSNHFAQYLEKQNRYAQAWTAWTDLECDLSQNSISDWTAVKVNNQGWFTVNSTGGLC